MGGGAPAVFSRIARHADGWLITPRLRGDPASLAGPLTELHREIRRAGRDPRLDRRRDARADRWTERA